MSNEGTSEDADVFPTERLLGLGDPIYTSEEVAAKAGLDLEVARRVWRAIGFVDPPEDAAVFTAADVEVLGILARFLENGLTDLDLVLGMTRVMSQALARVADAEAHAMRDFMARTPEVTELSAAVPLAAEIFPALETFLLHLWRRQLAHALVRADVLHPAETDTELAVGFADLVGFTRLARQVDEAELARIVERFEGRSHELAAEVGARIVKTIGDEVMFVADDPSSAAELALRLTESLATSEEEIEVRVGVAHGAAIAHRGDYFGPTVNLASRTARMARPNTVLLAEAMARALEDRDDLAIRPIRRRKLKGIGPTDLFVLRRRGD